MRVEATSKKKHQDKRTSSSDRTTHKTLGTIMRLKIRTLHTTKHQQRLPTRRGRESWVTANVEKVLTPTNDNQNKHCHYNYNYGHNTKDCVALTDKIEELIQVMHLHWFVQRNVDWGPRETRQPRGFKRDPLVHHEGKKGRCKETHLWGVTIVRGFVGGKASSSTRKRHLRIVQFIHMLVRLCHIPSISCWRYSSSHWEWASFKAFTWLPNEALAFMAVWRECPKSMNSFFNFSTSTLEPPFQPTHSTSYIMRWFEQLAPQRHQLIHLKKLTDTTLVWS